MAPISAAPVAMMMIGSSSIGIPADDPGNTPFKLGLSVTNDATAGISLKTVLLTLSASGESVSTTGNTLTVSFMQTGVQAIQRLKDAADAECKYPNQDSQACIQAKTKLALAESPVGLGVLFTNH